MTKEVSKESTLRAAEYCLGIYEFPGFPRVKWAHLDKDSEHVVYGVKSIEDTFTVTFRGSQTIIDYLRDIEAAQVATTVGTVYAGFNDHMNLKLIQQILNLADHVAPGYKKIELYGHSLGAAHANVATALLKKHYPIINVQARVLFGEPMTGDAEFAEHVRGVPSKSFRAVATDKDHDYDWVTDLPFRIPALGLFNFVRPTPLTDLFREVKDEDFQEIRLNPLHSMKGYARATKELTLSRKS